MKKYLLVFATVTFTTISFGQSKIKFDIMEHDFGAVEEGTIPTKVFRYSNEGKDSLALSMVKPSCGCTTPNWPKDTLLAGETSEITVKYNSKGRIGAFNKTINVLSNAVNEHEVLRIKGVVIKKAVLDTIKQKDPSTSGKIALSKKSYHFGTIERGKPKNYKFTVNNTGKGILNIINVHAGCHCTNFKINNSKIEAGKSATIELTYYPRNQGQNKEILVIESDDPTQPYLQFDMTADVINSVSNESMLYEGGSFGF